MTACSRRNFVSGMGALILMTGTSVTSLAKEEKADKPKRYAMVHDENSLYRLYRLYGCLS